MPELRVTECEEWVVGGGGFNKLEKKFTYYMISLLNAMLVSEHISFPL